MTRVVLDTNVLLVSLPLQSPFRPVLDALLSGGLEWVISEGIYLEYLEIIQQQGSKSAQILFDEIIINSGSLIKVDPKYHWRIPFGDDDDNKFVDAYIAGNADYLVTADRHYNSLKHVPFPRVNVLYPTEFLALLPSILK